MPASRSLLTIAILASSSISTQAARFIPLDVLRDGDADSYAWDISADGRVVSGTNNPFTDSQSGIEPFRWTEETGMVGLGEFNGSLFTGTSAISGDGSVVVGESYNANGSEAYRWTETTGTIGLGQLTHTTFPASAANGISADGSVIVGGTRSASNVSYSVRWTNAEGIVTLGDAPGRRNSYATAASGDGSVIVGTMVTNQSTEAYRWTQGTGIVGLGDFPHTLPGANLASSTTDVSMDGSVIIGNSAVDQTETGFRWTEPDGFVPLAALVAPEYGSQAFGLSADGSIIVGASGLMATRWTATNEPRSVGDLLAAAGVDIGDWQLREARAVSADGNVIVGWGYSPNGNIRGWIADLSVATPEPPTLLALLTGGLAVLIGRGPQRAKK